MNQTPARKVGDRGDKGKAVDYKETGSDEVPPTDLTSPSTALMEKKKAVEATGAAGNSGLTVGVQNSVVTKDSEDTERLDAADSTPTEDLATRATAPEVEHMETPTTESAPAAGPLPTLAAVVPEGQWIPPVVTVIVEPVVPEPLVQEEEEIELIAVQAENNVFEIVERNCEDAI